MTYEEALAIAKQDSPMPHLAGKALKVLIDRLDEWQLCAAMTVYSYGRVYIPKGADLSKNAQYGLAAAFTVGYVTKHPSHSPDWQILTLAEEAIPLLRDSQPVTDGVKEKPPRAE